MVTRFGTVAIAAAAIGLTGSILYSQEITRLPSLGRSEPTWESCDEMHATYVERFASTPGFGLSRMSRPPMLDTAGILDLGRTKYAIARIELVGLLHRETPVVYVPSFHGQPAPDRATFSDRGLSDFEETALDELRAGRNMATSGSSQSTTLQCMGALRAKETCVTCHRSSKVGDLLGAFTYRLRVIDQSSNRSIEQSTSTRYRP